MTLLLRKPHFLVAPATDLAVTGGLIPESRQRVARALRVARKRRTFDRRLRERAVR